MTTKQESQIVRLRRMGNSYQQISDSVDMPLNTVKSFCRRRNITVADSLSVSCAQCGKDVPQREHRKAKKFCSDACRMKWWNAHRTQPDRKKQVSHQCLCCGREFWDYSTAERKYCSHQCYIADRFGGL